MHRNPAVPDLSYKQRLTVLNSFHGNALMHNIGVQSGLLEILKFWSALMCVKTECCIQITRRNVTRVKVNIGGGTTPYFILSKSSVISQIQSYLLVIRGDVNSRQLIALRQYVYMSRVLKYMYRFA